MSAVYFVADTHFGSDNLRRFEDRPFKTVEEMDEELIRRWNEKVTDDDVVYHLGDFGAEGHEAEILSKLNGSKYLVIGNHDINSNEYYRQAGFEEVYDMPVIFEGFWVLSHEPLYVCENMPYANIFGHVHGSPIYKDYSKHHCCVSVERTEYEPMSFEEIKSKVMAE